MTRTPKEFTVTVRLEDALRDTIEVSPELISDLISQYRLERTHSHVEGRIILEVTRESWNAFTRKTGYEL